MADIDLKDALIMFQSGMRDLAQSNAVGEANSVVQQIRASQMKEQEKQAALQNVANNLAMRLTQTGASPAQIETVAQRISPPGARSLEEYAVKALESQDPEKLANVMSLMNAKKSGEKAEKITASDVKDLAEYNSVLRNYEEIEKEAQENTKYFTPGAVVGFNPWGEERGKFNAFKAKLGRTFDRYKRVTTGQAAGVKEIEDMKKSMINDSDSFETFKAKLNDLKAEAIRDRNLRIKTLQQAGRDTSDLGGMDLVIDKSSIFED